MTKLEDIKAAAVEKGACSLIESANSIADLASLLKSPQGREFCKKYKYPSLSLMREYKSQLAEYDIYVDAGLISFQDKSDILIAGDTVAIFSIRANDKPYFVYVMDGAKAVVNSYGYSVCLVDRMGGDAEIHQNGNSRITLG